MDTRVGRALQEAAKLIDANSPSAGEEPASGPRPPTPSRTTTICVRRGTLPDEAAVREWLREQEEQLRDAVRHGPVIVR